jgi:hypothetical protein
LTRSAYSDTALLRPAESTVGPVRKSSLRALRVPPDRTASNRDFGAHVDQLLLGRGSCGGAAGATRASVCLRLRAAVVVPRRFVYELGFDAETGGVRLRRTVVPVRVRNSHRVVNRERLVPAEIGGDSDLFV